MSKSGEIKDTDWRLYMCNQETGTDFLNAWGPESEMRESMAREANWGRDVWLIAPDGSKVLPGGENEPSPVDAFDEDLPTDITTLVGRCEIGETKFDNDDMSQALKFGEMLWNRLCKMAEHYENMADQYGTGSLRSDMLLQGAKDMRHVLEDTRKDCGL